MQHMNNYRYKISHLMITFHISRNGFKSTMRQKFIFDNSQAKQGRRKIYKNMRVRSNNMEQLIFNQLLDRESIAQEIKDVLEDLEQTKGDLLKKRGLYIYGAPVAGKPPL